MFDFFILRHHRRSNTLFIDTPANRQAKVFGRESAVISQWLGEIMAVPRLQWGYSEAPRKASFYKCYSDERAIEPLLNIAVQTLLPSPIVMSLKERFANRQTSCVVTAIYAVEDFLAIVLKDSAYGKERVYRYIRDFTESGMPYLRDVSNGMSHGDFMAVEYLLRKLDLPQADIDLALKSGITSTTPPSSNQRKELQAAA